MKMRNVLLAALGGAGALAGASPAMAQDYYLGQIITVANNFCPYGTMEATGTILPIAQYTALFSLYGTMYGGNGQTTFALPDLRGRAPNGEGSGPGLSTYDQGEVGGVPSTTLTVLNLPSHTHTGVMRAAAVTPNSDNPANAVFADFPSGQSVYNNNTATNVTMAFGTVIFTPSGSNNPVPTLSPYLVLRYCVVMNGIFPSRP